MVDKFIEYMQDAGLYFEYRYLPVNQDVVVVHFSDRCDLKTKRTYMMGIAFSGLEQLQANFDFFRSKADYALADYTKAMKPLGGFERADLRVSP